MVVYFESMTGNVRRFLAKVVERVGVELRDLKTAPAPTEPFVLMTHTFGRGEVPIQTARFLDAHGALLRGVAVSGSYHWGENFGRAGDVIARQYGVPLIVRVNKSGDDGDAERLAAWLRNP